MNLETFDAIFMTIMPVFFVIVALILFPLSIIGKVVIIALFMKSLRTGSAAPALVALLLGPAALALSRGAGDKKTATSSPDRPATQMPPAGDPPPFELLEQF
ncbi:MAG: hypothetical protein L6461_21610 [Anaerolineae bacterium]|nr:hypothetical protein [Anaerolineae bacterium]